MRQQAKDGSEVFDQIAFFDRFDIDLKMASREIRIQSPFVSINRLEKLASIFSKKAQAGVRVCIFVQEPEDWSRRERKSLDVVSVARLKQFETAVEMLQALGAHVNIRKGIHAKVAVLDAGILWDGSLNILSFGGRTEERMTRWFDPARALEAIKLHRLANCTKCAETAKTRRQVLEDDLDIKLANIGPMIARRRKRLAMSQSELARNVEISRNALGDIESGRSNPSSAVFLKLSHALGKTVNWLNRPVLPTVARLLELEDE